MLNEKNKDFNAKQWLEKWKYEHTKEFIIFQLKEHNFNKIVALVNYLWINDKWYLFKNSFKLLNDVTFRSLKFLFRKLGFRK